MKMIVNDVLDFAKPINLSLNEEDIRDIINNACDFCKKRADDKAVDLNISLPDDPAITSLDWFNMQRALVNLINNALDASLIGNSISIAAAPENEYMVIRIIDNGLGMDKETVENIFIPFYTKKISGTGIGMAIAKKIIEGHKGRIHINSTEHAGTEIKLELPLFQEPPPFAYYFYIQSFSSVIVL